MGTRREEEQKSKSQLRSSRRDRREEVARWIRRKEGEVGNVHSENI